MADPVRPLLATLGDPAGVGPECLAAAWRARRGARIIAVGDPASLERQGVPVRVVAAIEAADYGDAIDILPSAAAATIEPGVSSQAAAASALEALDLATRLTLGGRAAALVTGPVAKAAMHEVGFAHPGQTEFLAAACGLAPDAAVMMLAAHGLRVVPLTIHMALRDVPTALTSDLIVQRARVVASELSGRFGIGAPRLALAGLNPHAGEGGAFGDEEARVLEPALAQLRAQGIAIDGPIPADTLFAPMVRDRYDAILCAYHDQALTPFKALHFHDGVNVTLGLPFVRTSPDHGTAFALAGRGLADPGPTIAAIDLALALTA